ncbi:Beta-galactosidase 16 [Morella rubra]|uniref:beta-galactosidase n=1 Tax=Morella rubra TaxID=262757 RepID=A0A6A1W7A7_9ROSI|nr:Beta-galactosidase 16 [Morella rubra]
MELVRLLCWFMLLLNAFRSGHGQNVTYDGRSLIINGEHRILFCGSIHYPRSTPEFHTHRFVKKIVDVMKSEGLYASQGGPIILSQIDNEYTLIEPAFHAKGPPYVRWAANMAVGLQTGVPWVMCRQDDAPDPVVSLLLDPSKALRPNSPNKPALWTENWTSFYQTYGGETYLRSAEDIAFHAALFIAKKGSYVNYYMYHGGTNLEETPQSMQQPVIMMKLLWMSMAYVFKRNTRECAAFLVNNGTRDINVLFNNCSHVLPRYSISILPDCKTTVFNTAKFKEVIPTFEESSIRANTLLEQMETTKDTTDYLWYTFRLQNDNSNAQSVLNVASRSHILHAFTNGVYTGKWSACGSHSNRTLSLETSLTLRNGTNYISLLSVMVGMPDGGAYLEHQVAGLRRVRVQGKDLTNQQWGYQVGLLGEKLQIYTSLGSSTIQWSTVESSTPRLTWYKTLFDAPAGTEPVALNLGSMGKGEAWVNGQSIGRYWVSFHTSKGNPSQTWYNIPRSFLKPKDNLLVLLKEQNGYPFGISMDTISRTKVCGFVSDSHLPPVTSWTRENQSGEIYQKKHGKRTKLYLQCPPKSIIAKISFASFGTPFGNCESYAIGRCHLPNSRAITEKACLGKSNCSIAVSSHTFGSDPCPGVPKALLIDAQCT